MSDLNIKIKKTIDGAVLPTAAPGDAGLDLVAVTRSYFNEFIEYDTGLSVEIPEGYVGLIYPRSSISKYDLTLSNSVGIIDSSYRGNIKVRFKFAMTVKHQWDRTVYNTGDKIAQLIIMPYPKVTWLETTELSETERGDGGFGSTGT